MAASAPPIYFKDIWSLGPQENKDDDCPGRFPNGFMNRLMERWGKGKADKLMMFSGTFHEPGWVTVDIRPKMTPTIVADCEELPFPDASFDLVVMDPPYSEEEAMDLYDLPYVRMGKALEEGARVLRPGGTMCLLHSFYFDHFNGTRNFNALQVVGIVGVIFTSCNCKMRALTVWRKHNTMRVFESAEEEVSACTL